MDGGKGTYVGRPGRGVGSGSEKEDKRIVFIDRIKQYCSQISSAQAASYKQKFEE